MQEKEVTTCWACGLNVLLVSTPAGKVPDPKHDCMTALKARVKALESQLADTWG